MKAGQYLKVAGGMLFSICAVSCLLRLPRALAVARTSARPHVAYGAVFGRVAGFVLWGAVSFSLLRSANKK